jgi:hypothetical protein
MPHGDADELLVFRGVRVLKATAGALRCLIADRRVWLPRQHIKGRLLRPGDSGTLMVRRWIALDRRLMIPATLRLLSPVAMAHGARRLRLVRNGRARLCD